MLVAVVALELLVVLASGACSGMTNCGSCAAHTVLGAHACHWCEIDQACHDLGSPDSACAPGIENDHCVSKASTSTCKLSTCPDPADAYRARHLHLALAGPTGMRVAWKTRRAPTKGCSVTTMRGSHNISKETPADGFVQYLVGHGYHHVATVRDLIPGQVYFYSVSCDGAVSDARSFHLPRTDLSTARALVIGDMGTRENGQAMDSRKQIDALKASTDLTVHVGDIAYADDSFLHADCTTYFCYEAVYDQYMEWMENVMDSKPYMVVPGNHESECHAPNCLVNPTHKDSLRNFSAYNSRWHMPSKESGGVQSMWHSFDYGPIHFVGANTETDFPDAPEMDYGDGGKIIGLKAGHFAPDGEYLKWLEADLAAANKNRAVRPWIVALGHRTWVYRAGEALDAAVEKAHRELFVKYGVDLYLAGHQHSYSHQLPVNSSTRSPPVVVTGAAGCDEGLEGWDAVNGTANGWAYYSTGKVHQVGTVEATKETLTWKAYNSASGEIFDTFSLHAAATVAEYV